MAQLFGGRYLPWHLQVVRAFTGFRVARVALKLQHKSWVAEAQFTVAFACGPIGWAIICCNALGCRYNYRCCFGKIISSLVADLVMPPCVLVGGVDFTKLAITLKEAVGSVPAVTLNYGNFIQAVVDFTIIAFAIFMMVKLITSLRNKRLLL